MLKVLSIVNPMSDDDKDELCEGESVLTQSKDE